MDNFNFSISSSIQNYISALKEFGASEETIEALFYDEDIRESEFNPSSSEHRCGHTVEDESLPDNLGGYCCYRPIWEDYDKCIWHAEMSRKPPAEIRRAHQFENWIPDRYSHMEFRSRMDETHLNNFHVEDNQTGVSFMGCTMANSDFSYARGGLLSFQNVNLFGSNFERVDFEYAMFQGCDIHEVDFRAARLQNSRFHSSDLEKSNFTSAELSGANLFNTTLRDVGFEHAKLLEDAYLHQADCTGANFEKAQMEGTDFRESDLTDARFYETLVRSGRLSEGTILGRKCVYEKESDKDAAGEWYSDQQGLNERLENPRAAIHRLWNRFVSEGNHTGNLSKSIRVYRLYQRLLRENSLPDEIQHYRIRERHVRRKLALTENRYLSWLNLSIQRWTALYGESYWRVIFTSIFVIILSAIFYPLFGIREVASNSTLTYQLSFNNLVTVVAKSLYFSTSTFTTLGYGDLQPVGWGQAVATVESFLGAVLIALLVFVFARQATW